MNPKGSSLSSTDSFYFQFSPSYFKVEHAFAKNMKSGCVYRLVLYKGIQKVDEMAEGVKGKLIGGRIVFQPTALAFYLPIFTPTRNIEFTVKVFEAKPNEQQVEIAQLKLKSGDYIKALRSQGTSAFHEQAQLLDAFVLVFDLFVQNSKAELEQVVKEHHSKSKAEGSRINRMTTPGKAHSEVSQSDISDNSREGGMFNSKKKLSRKRGHDGKMKSRHGSRENSEISSREGSVRSSKKAFGPFPHTQQNEHFVHSPKKASPPKVEETSPPKSQPGKPQNLVSVGRKDSNASEISKPKLPNTPTKPVKIESNIERSESARKNPSYTQRSDILPTETPVAPRRQPLTKREEPAKAVTPRAANVHNLEFKGNEKVFDIQNKRSEVISSSAKSFDKKGSEVLPPKNPVSKITNKNAPVTEVQQDVKTPTDKGPEFTQIIQIPDADLSPPEQRQQQAKTTVTEEAKLEAKPVAQPEKVQVAQEQPVKQAKQPSQARAPSAKASAQSKGSRAALPMMTLKNKQVLDQQQRGVPELKMKQSMSYRNASSPVQVQTGAEESANKEYESTKDKIFYALFFIVSAFLFYNAVTPSRRV